MKQFIFCIALAFGTIAFADSGSASLSCSGNVKLCPSCNTEYFYIYTYQYAYVNNGKAQNENHSFSMNGFLGDSNSYKLLSSATGRHVVYSKGEITLAIPYKDSSDGIWIMGEGLDLGPGTPPISV